MPRGVKKENLPSKLCEVCQRPFTWRKVWERCWDDVKTCSDRCKAERKKQNKLSKAKEEESTTRAADASNHASQMLVAPNHKFTGSKMRDVPVLDSLGDSCADGKDPIQAVLSGFVWSLSPF